MLTPEFVRSKLFKPFVSTKQSGFGIGAYIRSALLGHSDPDWYRREQLTQRWRNYGRHLGRHLRR